VGFGITEPAQAREICRIADGVVIGSAVVKMMDENRNNTELIKIVAGYVSKIKQALV